MNKTELLKKVAEVTGHTQKQVDEFFAAYAKIVLSTLKENDDDKVTLPDLGTFKVKKVKERRGIIQMGENKGSEWVTPAHNEVSFTVTKTAKCL